MSPNVYDRIGEIIPACVLLRCTNLMAWGESLRSFLIAHTPSISAILHLLPHRVYSVAFVQDFT